MNIEAGVVRRPAARTTPRRHVVRVGDGSVVGLEFSGTPGQRAAGLQRAGVGVLVRSLAREPVVAQQAHPREPAQHAPPDRLDDPAEVGGTGCRDAMEPDIAGGTADEEAVGREDM
jgi:hypothetical protein